ncbi:MAG: peptidoglycan-binding protein [Rhizobiaceae bacterium]|nr:peptidoglycan-binding protein [Rhizobiaceae bacterium]MCV0406315.1 peptidoglycan-binding protein [Rhizobiaceae bacterium]
MRTSKQGRAFISGHEGNPLTAYLDPVGVPTIGHGFTMRSAAVKRELAKIGITKLVPGKTKITAAQSDAIFAAVLASAEFEGAVNARMPKNRVVKQHMFDAMSSATWNLGAGFMGWRWIEPWRDMGDVAASAAIWASSYNTAAGRKLAGLVRRRKEEARLFAEGRYTGVKEGTPRVEQEEAPRAPDPVTKEAQEILTKLGIPVEVDGWYGPRTKAAILAYQKMHPHLVNDGVLGPATLAQLRRDVAAAKDAVSKGIPGVGGIGALSWVAGLPWGWIALAAGVAVAGYFAWRYRDVIQRRWNKLRGKTVEV